MYGLPHTTLVQRQLPKKAIYTKFELKPAQRESFDADVSRIDIAAVISPRTIPAIAEGETIKEFYLLTVQLKRKDYDEKNIVMLSKLIPQNILFALQYEDETQLATYHTKLLYTPWISNDNATIPLTGLNLNSVWENIIKEIGEIEVQEGNTLEEQIQKDEQKRKLLAQIATLENKMAKEPQPKRKREYYDQIKKLKIQL